MDSQPADQHEHTLVLARVPAGGGADCDGDQLRLSARAGAERGELHGRRAGPGPLHLRDDQADALHRAAGAQPPIRHAVPPFDSFDAFWAEIRPGRFPFHFRPDQEDRGGQDAGREGRAVGDRSAGARADLH